ncbi:MAG: hypothetical protein NT154_44365, partial [Verrucomicrobia bacterium]|nr:hypothetical protein [Verrucomicrobiota bacterium]
VRKGPYYLWTCKLKGKTVCVALSRSQYLLLAQAICNNRRTQKLLERRQALTLKTILRKVPGVRKRKCLISRMLCANYAPFRGSLRVASR